MSFSKLLNRTCNIKARVATQNASGQIAEVWTTLYSGVKTRMTEPKKNFTIEDGKYKVTKELFVFFFDASYELLITKDHRISYNGKEYYIVRCGTLMGNTSQHHMEVHVQLVSIGGQAGMQSGLSADTTDFATEAELEAGLATKQSIGTNYDDKTFVLPFVSTNMVVVNHNLNKRPSVIVIDSSGDEVEGNITYNSANQLTLTFSATFSGTVYCN